MSDALTADDIRALLGLEPNATCGFVRETFRRAARLPPAVWRRHLLTEGRSARRFISW
jgi:hypothetical protein